MQQTARNQRELAIVAAIIPFRLENRLCRSAQSCPVSDFAQPSAAIREILADAGELHVLCNCAQLTLILRHILRSSKSLRGLKAPALLFSNLFNQRRMVGLDGPTSIKDREV